MARRNAPIALNDERRRERNEPAVAALVILEMVAAPQHQFVQPVAQPQYEADTQRIGVVDVGQDQNMSSASRRRVALEFLAVGQDGNDTGAKAATSACSFGQRF